LAASPQGGEYGCWVGGGSFTEVFSSQARAVARTPDAPYSPNTSHNSRRHESSPALHRPRQARASRAWAAAGAQGAAYGGWEGARTNAGGVLRAHDGKLWINVPGQTTLVFRQEA